MGDICSIHTSHPLHLYEKTPSPYPLRPQPPPRETSSPYPPRPLRSLRENSLSSYPLGLPEKTPLRALCVFAVQKNGRYLFYPHLASSAPLRENPFSLSSASSAASARNLFSLSSASSALSARKQPLLLPSGPPRENSPSRPLRLRGSKNIAPTSLSLPKFLQTHVP